MAHTHKRGTTFMRCLLDKSSWQREVKLMARRQSSQSCSKEAEPQRLWQGEQLPAQIGRNTETRGGGLELHRLSKSLVRGHTDLYDPN